MPKPAKRFIAHSSRDRAFVDRLAHVLHAHHLPYWYSKRHIVGAQQWHDEIGRALAACNWLLLVLSPNAVRAKWVKSEVLFALDSDAYRDHIVVLDYGRGADYKKLSWTLRQYQWVSFHEGLDAGFTNLLRIWGRRYKAEPRGTRATRSVSARRARRRRSR